MITYLTGKNPQALRKLHIAYLYVFIYVYIHVGI